MPITLEELRELLSSDEPDYAAIAQMLDPSAAPHLETLARDPDLMLATKAVYAASLLPSPQSEAVVAEASESPEAVLRIASASAIANLPEDTRNRLAERLISDHDVSVKKLAIKAVSGPVTPQLRQRLDELASTGETALLRQLANDKLSQP